MRISNSQWNVSSERRIIQINFKYGVNSFWREYRFFFFYSRITIETEKGLKTIVFALKEFVSVNNNNLKQNTAFEIINE